MSDDIFRTPSGEPWLREWITRPAAGSPTGESPGATKNQSARYEWRTADRRLLAWCESRNFVDDPAGGRVAVHVYRASVDGRTSERSWPTLAQAMAAAEQARWLKDYRERERESAASGRLAAGESEAATKERAAA